MNIDVITVITMAVVAVAAWGYLRRYRAKPSRIVSITALIVIHAIVAARMWLLWPDETNLTLLFVLDTFILYNTQLKGRWKHLDRCNQICAVVYALLINTMFVRLFGRHTGWHIQDFILYVIFELLQVLATVCVWKIIMSKRTTSARA